MQQLLAVTGNGPGDDGQDFTDPVFVLCNGRSGSTLLRFLLDAHPDLACPPETNVPALCAQLATVWSLIEGAPLSANRGDEPPMIPDAAVAGIRATMNMMLGSYLERRGKKRYCDKSLGTARFAELLLRMYPRARFLCLYRHPMDVIASGMEACPWGLNGYGFDPYIATTPGNTVLALARFWADNAAETLAAEERFAEHSLRVRYEDLVTDPEAIAAKIFDFLGAAPVPGISESCFSAERERYGPGDHKIWYTSKITADSIGRGWSVPVGLIAPAVLAIINELAGNLGYLQIDGDWGTSEAPQDLRLLAADTGGNSDQGAAGKDLGVADRCEPRRSEWLGSVLRDGLAGTDRERLGPHAAETFVAVSMPSDPQAPADYWQVDLSARTVSPASRAAQENSDWDVIGQAEAWEQVISGSLNLSAALRSCRLRYCDDDESGPFVGDARLAILGRLLGVTNW